MCAFQAEDEERKENHLTMIPTIDDLITEFENAIQHDIDAMDPDPETMFLSAVLFQLRAIQADFAGQPVTEDVKLSSACARIPGLLHLARLY